MEAGIPQQGDLDYAGHFICSLLDAGIFNLLFLNSNEGEMIFVVVAELENIIIFNITLFYKVFALIIHWPSTI